MVEGPLIPDSRILTDRLSGLSMIQVLCMCVQITCSHLFGTLQFCVYSARIISK